MTPVTDPILVAQLEGSGGQSLGTPVTDPTVISQLEGAPQQPQTNPSFLPRMGADALAGLAQMGHGLINSPHNIVSYFNPQLGAKIPAQQDYNYGQMLGVNKPNMIDSLVQGAAQYAPYMMGGEAALAAKGLEAAPSLLARLGAQTGAGATFGATQSQNPAVGAAMGAGLGAAGELAPAAISGAKNLLSNSLGAIQPQKYAEQIMQTLGGGKTLEANAQSLANDIKNAYKQKTQAGGELYQPVFDQAGNNSIYSVINPENSAYNKLDKSITGDAYGPDLRDLHQSFIDNPNFQNAHDLRSQLSSSIRQLSKNPAPDVATTNTVQAYQKAKNAINTDMNSYLAASDSNLADQYQAANNYWASNVAPYKENSAIAKIATGKITNPSSITSIFSKPEPSIQQIVNDIGPQANNKILYSALGKTQANLTPEKLTGAFNQLDNKGLGSYVTPSLQEQFDQLASKTAARNMAQTATTGVLGAHFFGPFGAVAGAAGPTAMRKIGQLLPSLKTQLLSNALSKAGAAYRPLVNAVTANAVNNYTGQQ